MGSSFVARCQAGPKAQNGRDRNAGVSCGLPPGSKTFVAGGLASGPGKEPWYLLTNEPVEDSESAWRVVLAYARRWQIEMSLRFHKSELAVESPRL